MSSIEDKVILMIRERAKIGEATYGTTMDRKDLEYEDWIQHLQEELLDSIIYIEKLKSDEVKLARLKNILLTTRE
jgi:hypothetical protein